MGTFSESPFLLTNLFFCFFLCSPKHCHAYTHYTTTSPTYIHLLLYASLLCGQCPCPCKKKRLGDIVTDMQVNAKCLYGVKVNKLYNSHKLLSLMSFLSTKKTKISEYGQHGILLLCLSVELHVFFYP